MKNKEIEEILNYMKQKQYISEKNINFGYKILSAGQVDLLLSYIEQLENNRDKAIEVIDLITPELWNISNAMTYKLKDIKYILKGGSDE